MTENPRINSDLRAEHDPADRADAHSTRTGYGLTAEVADAVMNRMDAEQIPATDETLRDAAATAAESDTEIRMRADYMQARGLGDRLLEEYDPGDEVERAAWTRPWNGAFDQGWAGHWSYLEQATKRWRTDPVAAEQARRDATTLSPIQQRSEDQARHIAEHGITYDPQGRITSHYVTRVNDRPDLAALPPGPPRPVTEKAAWGRGFGEVAADFQSGDGHERTREH
ncbi:hypothetical protein [Nocardia arizonensis]|uniref:hypothetical protein n=1 Tax=Nocardia arizonensis TaxID=1141647 RepID=UPI0006D05AA2|nr:hypothetical protein [Nocardia arizonensis]